MVLGQLPSKDNSPPNKNKAQPLPTGATTPTIIPHQDNSPLRPLPQNKNTSLVNHSSGPIPVRWGIVLVGICQDTHSDYSLITTGKNLCGFSDGEDPVGNQYRVAQ